MKSKPIPKCHIHTVKSLQGEGFNFPFLPLNLLGFFSSCGVEHPQCHLLLRSRSLTHQLHVWEGPPGDGTPSTHSKRSWRGAGAQREILGPSEQIPVGFPFC